MPGPRPIGDYLAELSAELPAWIIDEMADGLDEAYHCYLGQGLDEDAAARAAVAEFGEPRVLAAAFTQASSGRRTARRTLAAGPVVGLCWGIALITARAWQWPVPVLARVALGVALITVIGMLATEALGRRYGLVCRAAAAACAGTAILDVVVASTVLAIAPALMWPVAMAVALSAGRSGFAVRCLPHALARRSAVLSTADSASRAAGTRAK